MNESFNSGVHLDVIYSNYFDCTVFKMTVFIFLMYSRLWQPVDGIILFTAGDNKIMHTMTTIQCEKDYSFNVVRVYNFKWMRKNDYTWLLYSVVMMVHSREGVSWKAKKKKHFSLHNCFTFMIQTQNDIHLPGNCSAGMQALQQALLLYCSSIGGVNRDVYTVLWVGTLFACWVPTVNCLHAVGNGSCSLTHALSTPHI